MEVGARAGLDPRPSRRAVRTVTVDLVIPEKAGDGSTHAGVAMASAGFFLLAVLQAVQAHQSAIDGYGLISVLPVTWFVLVAAMLGLYLWSSCWRTAPTWLTYVQLALVVTTLTALPVLVEALPRFSTTFVHAGFAERLARTGRILPGTDARYSWPGFFALAAAASDLAGVEPLRLVRWAAVVQQLLCLPGLVALVRWFCTDRRQQAAALLVAGVANWIGQDYFSPQATNVLLFLSFAALLLHVFSRTAGPSRAGRLLAGVLLRRGERAETGFPTFDVATAAGAVLAVLLLYSASVVSHQLTQFFMILFVLTLVVLGSLRLPSLPVLLVLITGSYIVFGAADFWQGHLKALVAAVGDLSSSVQANVSDRVAGGVSPDPARTLVLRVRLLMTGAVYVFALIGLLRNRSHRSTVAAALTASPVLVLALQSYGGEGLLRVYLFSLPFAAVLASEGLAPRGGWGGARRGQPPVPWSMAAFVLLVPGFLLARYGNESFEQMRPADRATIQKLYAVARPGSTAYAVGSSIPWKDRRVDDLQMLALNAKPYASSDLSPTLAELATGTGPTYLVITQGQLAEIREELQVSETAITNMLARLDAEPGLSFVYRAPGQRIYRVDVRP